MATKIGKIKFWSFAQSAFLLGCTAFGGPQIHIPLFVKRLTEQKKYISKEDLLDINAFCSILPGPSTTQTLTAVGFKLGGPRLAFLTLLAWILPGALILSLFVLLPNLLTPENFTYVPSMVAAFFIYSVFSMLKLVRPDWINFVLIAILSLLTALVKSPIIFPIAIIIGAFLSAHFGSRKYVRNSKPFGKVNWSNLFLFLIIIVLVGTAGVLLSANEKSLGISKPFILFENTYRMGSLSFGGGNSLAAMALDQYVYHKPRLSLQTMNTGIGLVQGLPGPNFNLAVYFNGMAMRNLGYTFWGQLGGCLLGMVAVYLPGILLIFFAFPIWQKIKAYPIVQRSLDGVFAASVGFVAGAALLINYEFYMSFNSLSLPVWHLAVFVVSLGLLFSKRISPPLIVLLVVLLSFFT